MRKWTRYFIKNQNIRSKHLEKIPYGTYEQLRFNNWDKMETFMVEWLDELDAYLFNYEV